jgi:MscS family membrane protein
MQKILDLLNPTYWIQLLSSLPLIKIGMAILLFLFFLFLRRIFALFVVKVLRKIFLKSKNEIDDKSIKILLGPISFIFIIIGFNAFLIMLDIRTFITQNISKSLMVFDLFWFLYYLVDLSKSAFEALTKHYSKAMSNEVTKLLTRVFKFIVITIGLMSLLKVWGVNVSAFVASLGLGGLAFALAAKDAAANIFGSIAILADKAISVGEWIKVDGVEGIVMDIGMRTTKIKTFENSIITMPNQIIANTKIENYSRRNERRIKFRVGLTYDTTNRQMQNILNEIRDMLKSHQGVSKESTLIVNFDRFEDSSLSIFIYIFTNSSKWEKYLKIKEDINLKIIKIVEDNDAKFAFPTQSIYLENQDN